MALIEIKELKLGNFLGIWKIEEEEDELKEQLMLDESELEFLDSVTFPGRRRQWLASRVLIRKMVNPPGQILMDWNHLGQPVVLNYDFNVSISHCNEMAVALVGDRVSGIDVEKMSDKVNRIAPKFVREDEFDFIKSHTHQNGYLIGLWASKEALFKLKGGGGIDFKKHLKVNPFEMDEQGIFTIEYLKNGSQTFQMNYRWLGDHFLVWVL